MLINLAKSNIDFCRKNINKTDNPDIRSKFLYDFWTLRSNVRYGCAELYDSDFDIQAFDKKYDAFGEKLESLPIAECEQILNDLIELGEKTNKVYDESCKKASSFTVEGIIADNKSNSSIYLKTSTGYHIRIFTDRLNIPTQKLVRPNVGKTARVTGFLSCSENHTRFQGIPVATSIDIL
jgi:hypothetical protein